MIASRRYFAPTLYTTRLFIRTALEVCLLALLIEGLYLSERFISILKIVIDKPVGLENVITLLAWAAPEVYLALPLTALVATYRVVLLYRENREFIALASGGQGTLPLMQFASAVALAVLICSLLISGEVAPRAKFALRASIDAIQYQVLRAGSTPGQFLFFPNHFIYIWPSTGGDARPIFAKQILDDRTNRIVNAQNIEIVDHSSENVLVIGMLGVTMNDFPNQGERWVASETQPDTTSRETSCQGCAPRLNSLYSDSVVKTLDVMKLVPSTPRGIVPDEWTTTELLGYTPPPGNRSMDAVATSEVMRRLARGLLCFLTPFLAWLTLTFTNRQSQAFALPLACIGVMCADIAFSQIVTRLSGIGTPALLSVLVVTTCGLLALLISQIVRRQHLLIFPALGRS